MCASTPSSIIRWKRQFFGLEIFVVAACVYGMALRIIWPYDTWEHPHLLAVYRGMSDILMPMAYCFLAACSFLVIASLFLLRSRRRMAISALIVGVLALLWAGYILCMQ